MFTTKIPKSQRPSKAPFTIYKLHSVDVSTHRSWNDSHVKVVSIDPAIVNLAIRVERRPRVTSGKITTELFEKLNLKESKTDEEMMDSTFDMLSDYLLQHLDLFRTCHYVIIERQLPTNYKAVRISTHALSFFLYYLKDSPLLPIVLEVDPKLKGKMLGATTSNEKDLKKWAVQVATDLLEQRGDHDALQILSSYKKKDDLSDTVIQIEALFAYLELPLTAPVSVIRIMKSPAPSRPSISTSNGSIHLSTSVPATSTSHTTPTTHTTSTTSSTHSTSNSSPILNTCTANSADSNESNSVRFDRSESATTGGISSNKLKIKIRAQP
jgi:hypothetical protein